MKYCWLLLLVLACAPLRAVAEDRPDWAFLPIGDATRKPLDDTTPLHIPGSTKTYTEKQIHGAATAADWFPDSHPPMPHVVEFGRPPEVRTCSLCHGVMGAGNPESVDLAGLPAAYMVRQVQAFKNNERPLEPNGMELARNVSDEDLKEAAAYYASLKRELHMQVVETDTVPRSVIKGGHIRLRHPDGGSEALGRRIVVLVDDEERLHLHDPRVGFVVYVPKGSVAAGKELVTTGGGKTVPCAACHGASLQGQGEIPPLAGRSPLYVARQLFNIRAGTRKDTNVAMMTPVASGLQDEDILAIAAYLAGLKL